MTFSDAGFVFLPCGVEDVVTTVFDGPVFPVEFENAFCIGVLGAEACDAVDEFFGAFSGLDGGAGSVDAESLPDMGELDFVPDVVIEFCRGPDCAALLLCNISTVRANENAGLPGQGVQCGAPCR